MSVNSHQGAILRIVKKLIRVES